MKISNYLLDGKRQKRKRIFWLIFLTITLITTSVAFITFYGFSTGNFILGIENNPESKNISISLEPRSTENKKQINLYHNNLVSPGSFELINARLDEITKADGTYKGDLSDNLIATNFYIRNLNNNLGVNLKYYAVSTDEKNTYLKLTSWTMMLVYNNEHHIYHDNTYDKTIYPSNYKLHQYKDTLTLFENYIMDLGPGVEKRISIIIWNNGSSIEQPEEFKFKLYFQASDLEEGDIT